jgi:magnesium-transporting ATPase (P-type)
MREQMNNARTVAFIALVWAENFRAYASRSFDKPFFVNVLGNKYMQYAACSAQLALYAAVLVPGFSDKVLELRGLYIGAWGWLFALSGPLGTMILCELFKFLVTARQMRAHERSKTHQGALAASSQNPKSAMPTDDLSETGSKARTIELDKLEGGTTNV